ncbi:TraB/GumN family protein [Sphingosinicella sp. LHD-64]|uniref:TraB/GumN family protein n=1 Tax=Sphingosinicella sp. LHD-64 TaxID=3072139 RepID=UPI00280FE64F|nr:TraB/GumN family protein [Sphingosinicella sp. LHD-64]MDQ8755401.1 TraB/GumN family protein [Sphingosinicella sp. LHD-64]
MMRLAGIVTAACLSIAPAAAQPAPAAPSPAAEAPAAPRPALWLLADEDTKIYLFGTIHILPPDLNWRSAALNRAVDEADELVLEVDDEEMDNFDAGVLEGTMLGKSVPVTARVSPDRRDRLAEMIAASGVPSETLDGLQTWAVAMSLSVAQLADGYGADMQALTGVEEALTEDFRARGRPISGVETAAQQIGFFSTLPLSVQREMLEQTVDAWAEGTGDFDPGDADWLRGDLDAMVAELEEMPPELFDALLTRRNTSWTGWLIDRLERPGTVLFAVGAGHLAGRVSVQSMLAARGYRVSRVD